MWTRKWRTKWILFFMGTPDFAVPVLEALTASEKHTVKAVVTQPDKARGRSGKLILHQSKKWR